MKISQLESGMQVWSVTRTKMGNTTITTVIVHPVVIIEIHDNHVIARWNGNAPRRFGETAIRGWKKEKPLLVREPFGNARWPPGLKKPLCRKKSNTPFSIHNFNVHLPLTLPVNNGILSDWPDPTHNLNCWLTVLQPNSLLYLAGVRP